MAPQVLIATASRHGSTFDIADEIARVLARRGFVVGAAPASGIVAMSPGSVGCSTAARLVLRRFGVGVVAPVGSAASVAVVVATESFAAAASWRRVRRRVGVRVS